MYLITLQSNPDVSYARTVAFVGLGFFTVYTAYSSRSLNESVFRMNPGNKALLLESQPRFCDTGRGLHSFHAVHLRDPAADIRELDSHPGDWNISGLGGRGDEKILSGLE